MKSFVQFTGGISDRGRLKLSSVSSLVHSDLSELILLGVSPVQSTRQVSYCFPILGLENSRDCIVLRVAKSRTRLNGFHSLWCLSKSYSSLAHCLNKINAYRSRTTYAAIKILMFCRKVNNCLYLLVFFFSNRFSYLH